LVHADIITELSDFVNKKMYLLRKNLKSSRVWHFRAGLTLYSGRRQRVTFAPLCLAQVNSLEKERKLPGGDLFPAGIGKWKLKGASFQSFVPDSPAVPIPVENFKAIGTAVTENQ
jgi:hypothetical protein